MTGDFSLVAQAFESPAEDFWVNGDGRPEHRAVTSPSKEDQIFVTYREFSRLIEASDERLRKERVELSTKIDAISAKLDSRADLMAELKAFMKSITEDIAELKGDRERLWSAIDDAVIKGGEECRFVCKNTATVQEILTWRADLMSKLKMLFWALTASGVVLIAKFSDSIFGFFVKNPPPVK